MEIKTYTIRKMKKKNFKEMCIRLGMCIDNKIDYSTVAVRMGLGAQYMLEKYPAVAGVYRKELDIIHQYTKEEENE